jgi:hypothetical protein
MTLNAILKPDPFQARVFDPNNLISISAWMGATQVTQTTDYMRGSTEYIFARATEDQEIRLARFSVSPDDIPPMIVMGQGGVMVISVEEWNEKYQVLPTPEYHTENTLYKVRDILATQGFAPDQVSDAITELLNGGILFREVAPI